MFAEGYPVRINALPPGPDVSPPPMLDALYNPTRRPDDTVDYLPLSEARLPILRWGFLHGDATYDVVLVPGEVLALSGGGVAVKRNGQ